MKQINQHFSSSYRSQALKFFFLLVFLLGGVFGLKAQTPQFYNTDATATSNAFPLSSTSSNKVQWIYAPSVFNSAGTSGTPAYNGNITTIYFKVGTANPTAVYSNFYIKLGQNVGTAPNYGTTSNTSYPFNTGLTTCFYAATHSFTGIVANTWYPITLQTPFLYDPTQSLIFEMQVSSGTGNSVSQVSTTGQMQRLYGLFSATTGTSNTSLVKLGFDLVSAGPCSDPPTAGTAVTSLSTICSGQSAMLNLTGNSFGTGQTYQWESSASLSGPYTDIGPSSGNTNLSITPTSTAYYRCKVTCGTSTTTSTEVLVTVPPAFPGGTYTINSALPTGGTNFQSFSAAVAAISCGIAGPITFDVDPASGPYTEQITLGTTIGSNAVNTVTFNGNGRTIRFQSTNSNARHVIKLDGADYITFNDLRIDTVAGTPVTPTNYNWGIHLTNGADNNIVSLCTINTNSANTTAGQYQPIVMSNSLTSATTAGNNGNNNTFSDNTLLGGYYGITLCGNALGSENIGNNLSGNQIRDFYANGVYMIYQKNGSVITSDISRPARVNSTTAVGILLTTGCIGMNVESNRVHNLFDAMTTNTSACYGIQVSADATVAEPNRVVNNIVYNINGNGTLYGIYSLGSDHNTILHNTVSLDHAAATAGITYGVYQTTAATGVTIRNNIITIKRGGSGAKVGLYYNTTTSTITSNNNSVFLASSGSGSQNYGSFGTTPFANLSNWQTANGGIYDLNSVQADPLYVAPLTADFTPTAFQVNNIGVNLGVAYDINGNPRSAVTPDPGAIEFDLVGLDANITWVAPAYPVSAGLNTISVNISNTLSTTITDLVLTYTDGITPVTETFSGLNLLPYTSQVFNFASQYTITNNVTMRAYINSVNGVLDDNQANDTTILQNICLSLSGAYTINAALPTGGTNFQTFNALTTALACGGMAGPVTVDVVSGSGPYNEQVTFGVYPGSSALNTLTINGNGNVLTSAGGADYHTMRLNGIDNLVVNNLTINATGATNGFAMVIMNASDNNQFVNCTFNASQTATGTTSACVLFTNSTIAANNTGNNGNGNIFNGCTMNGGYYGVSVYGSSAANSNIVANQFLNCAIRNYYFYGLFNQYATSTIVRNCIFERPTRTSVSTGYGVFLTTGSLSCLIENNRFRNLFGGALTSTSAAYAIYCSAVATAGNENQIINNLISDIRHNGIAAGIYLVGPSFVKAYHNTISLDYAGATAGTTYGIYSTGASGIDIQNNLVSITRGGTGTKYCVYYTPLPTTTNYNNLYMNSPAGTANYVAYDGVTNHVSLAQYQGAQATKDQQSVSLDPSFLDPLLGNYAPGNAALDNLGTNVGVALDITGATRAATPDIGAYEFYVAPIDVGITAVINPGNGGCYSAAETVTVTLKNFGATTLDFSVTPVTVTLDVSGAITTSISELPGGTLAPLATMNVTFTTPINMTANGTYAFNTYATITGDGNNSNNALSPAVSRIVGPVGGSVNGLPATVCVSGSPVLTLSGHYGGSIQWQESTSPSGPWTNVGTGNATYTPSSPITQTSYYQAEISCNGNTAFSSTFTVTVNNPQVLSTSPGTRCGLGTVTLGATVEPGANAKWYTAATGGTSLFTGNTFTTPTIASTTTYYVEPVLGIGGADSISAPIGGTTGVYHHMFVMSSPTGLTLEAIGIKSNQALGTLTAWDVYYRTDNYQTVPGANTSATGWILLSSISNLPSAGTGATDYTFISIGQNLAIPPGGSYSFYIAPGTGTTHTYNTTAIGTIASSNANASIIAGNRGSSLFNCTTNGGLATVRMKYSLGCIGTRVPVLATVTTPPSITATAIDPVICPGGSTAVSVSSSNDPDYSYSWTSVPSGFTATGAGPHIVSPTAVTTYSVYAIDNSTGANAGCATTHTVTVVGGTVLAAGTVSAVNPTFCVSGTPSLSVSGSSGGAIQWQESNVSASGPWTNVGSGTNSYIPANPITQTTYYRVEVSCPSNSVQSNVVTITVNNPQLVSTTPGTRCGYGSVLLDATPPVNSQVQWFDALTGGNLLYVGSSFNTPPIASTTTFYAAAVLGGGGGGNASPIQLTEADLGGTDKLEIQNVSPDPIDVTGWKVAISNSYTDITSVNANIQVLSGIMNPGAIKTWSDATGPDYWGSNMFWNPGAFPSFTGWAAILDNNNVLRDFMIWNWPSANIAAASINIGGNTITVGSQWSGNGIDATTVAATNSLSRQGTQDNNNAADFAIIPLSIGTTNTGMTLPFLGFGCVGSPRTAVVATVTPSPAITPTASSTTTCAGGATTLSVSSPNDPDYTYTWNPGNLSGSSVTVSPTTNTVYTVTAIDNTSGANAGCGSVATIAITVNPIQTTASAGAAPSVLCEGGTVSLTSVTTAIGYTMNGACNTAFVDISVSGTDVDLPANILDDSEHNIGIPSFTYNGVAYTSARVGTNGVIALGSAAGDVSPANAGLPSTANTAGNIFLAPFWDDLYPTFGTNASIKTQTIGNTFIVQWTNMSHFDDTAAGTITFQAQLDLLSGTVSFVYSDAIFGNQLYDNGASATAGIQFSNTSAMQYSLNTASISNGQCISFAPNTVTVSWAGPNGFSSGINNPVLSAVTALESGTYTVYATGSNGCAATATANVQVNVASSSTTTVTECAPPYTWNGTTYTAAGIYTYTTLNAAGCDSIATLDLTFTPCNTTLNLTLYIQGFWDGTSLGMLPVLSNQFQVNPVTDCDTILVEVRDPMMPTTIVSSTTAVLKTNGTATCVFPVALTGSYYIAVKHRNAIETWSADPVAMGSVVSYNFADSITKAYGSNMVQVSSLPDVFAFYSGDVIKDVAESIDLIDLAQVELEINNFSFGYYAEDLNGDGNVDILDTPVIEPNVSNFVFSSHP